jgi:hypothetical protein
MAAEVGTGIGLGTEIGIGVGTVPREEDDSDFPDGQCVSARSEVVYFISKNDDTVQ